MDEKSLDLKKILSVGPTEKFQQRLAYTKETLIILEQNPSCHTLPLCLSREFLGNNGLWDPEKWHRSFSSPNLSVGPGEKTPNDEVDSVISDDSEVILGPQRRSFQGGCHVVDRQKPEKASINNDLPSVGSKSSRMQYFTSDHPNPNSRLKTSRSFEAHNPSRRSKQIDRSYSNFQSSRSSRNDWGERSNGAFQEEGEPEWMSYGPSSQFDTVELTGFDAGDFSWMGKKIPMDDVVSTKKSKKKDESNEAKGKGEDMLLVSDLEAEEEKIAASSSAEKAASDDEPTKSLFVIGGSSDEERSVKEENPEIEPSIADPFTAEDEPVDCLKIGLSPNIVATTSSDIANNNEAADFQQNLQNKSRFFQWFKDQEESDPAHFTSCAQGGSASPSISTTSKEDTAEAFKPADTESQNPSSRTTNVQGMDAFNRLVASIRATDKLKLQVQQRNQQIQALQSMMQNARLGSSNTLEQILSEQHAGMGDHAMAQGNLHDVSRMNDHDPLHMNDHMMAAPQMSGLKQQFERQKDLYQQKLKKIEEQQVRRSPLFPDSGAGNIRDSNQGLSSNQVSLKNIHCSYPMVENHSEHSKQSTILTNSEERAAVTALLAAKLTGKVKHEEGNAAFKPYMHNSTADDAQKEGSSLQQQKFSAQLQSQQRADYTKLLPNQHRMQSRSPAQPDNISQQHQFQVNANTVEQMKAKDQHQHAGALVIAQFLANAGVTEEQLKQLTLQQQELIISMVQKQCIQKDLQQQQQAAGMKQMQKQPEAVTKMQGLKHMNLQAAMHSAKQQQQQTPNGFITDGVGISFPHLPSDNNIYLGAGAHPHHQAGNLVQVSHQPTRLVSPPLVTANLFMPQILTAAPSMQRHQVPLVQTAPVAGMATPHQAMLQQLQKNLYLSQIAQQQQQVYAVAPKHHLNNHNQAIPGLQQAGPAYGIRLPHHAVAPGNHDRSHFQNPLSQWFSGDVLRQSQFASANNVYEQQVVAKGHHKSNHDSSHNP